MAYGFDTSASFGRMAPDGEFLGYTKHLEERFNEMSQMGQVKQKYFDDFRFDFLRRFHHGTDPIENDFLPKKYFLAKPYKMLGDIINLWMALAVSSQVRDLLEELEPDRHQFWPVELVLPSGELYHIKYYMLRVLTELDPFVEEKSDPGCWRRSEGITEIRVPRDTNSHGIAFSRQVIGNHHIWRGSYSKEFGISGADFYISDELKEALVRAGLRTPKFYQFNNV